ncbi:retrovirus-related Pol polyprotein from transposon TNT 1-94 [Trichonephila clavipes]|nr:retrovirus-related Pol polyprotein from transposon TNT 1-94 [Trichonephila clavipes]
MISASGVVNRSGSDRTPREVLNDLSELILTDEQALQFAAEDNAKVLWDKIRATYMGEGEDRKIDAGNELKNIRMKNGETVADYIARARGFRLSVTPWTGCVAEGIGLPYR